MTRRQTTLVVAMAFVCVFVVTSTSAAQNVPCRTIQDGGIYTQNIPIDFYWQDGHIIYLDDQPEAVPVLSTGYDDYGYNYGSHNYSGYYHNYTRRTPKFVPPEWVREDQWQWADEQLDMTWNDAWLSNQDCDGDGKLDRPTSYVGSGATLSVHMGGFCDNGKNWQRQVKIEAVPLNSRLLLDQKGVATWYLVNGKRLTKIGPQIWGNEWADSPFAVTRDSISNTCPERATDDRYLIPAPNPLPFQTRPIWQ